MKKFVLFLVIAFFANSCSNSSNKNKYETDIISVKSGDKWGYIDREGKYVVNPQFDDAVLFTEKTALIRSGDKFGFIDKKGSFIINPIYVDALSFSDGVACVVLENGYPSYVDKTGNVLFTVTNAEKARSFKEDLAAVLIKDKWGFIDKTGKIAIQPQFEYISDFFEGFALFKKKINGDYKYGFIDKTGKIVINPQFEKASTFSEDLALIVLDDKRGYINKEGKIMINPQFDFADNFSEGFAVIKQGDNYGYIDKTGKIIINPQFESAFSFQDGMALVKSSDGKYGYINNKGKYIINPQFENAGNFIDGIANIKLGDKYGFIDKEGKIIINPQYDAIFGNMYYNYVNSDYYDFASMIDILLDKTDESSFRNISSETTLDNIINDIYQGSDAHENTSYSIKIDDDVVLDEYIKLIDIKYNFKNKIYKYVPKYEYLYGYRYKTGSNKVYIFDSKVSSFSFTIDLNGKAINKRDKLKKALIKKLSKIMDVKPSSIDGKDVLENDYMKISIGELYGKIFIKIEFL